MISQKMPKALILNLCEELIEVPPLDKIIYNEFRELRERYRDKIKHYKKIKSFLKEQAYGEMSICEDEDDAAKSNRPYHFVLSKDASKVFIIECLEPVPPPGVDIHNILPQPVINFIKKYPPNTDRMVTELNRSFKELKGRTFDLRFVVFSEDKIVGNIRENTVVMSDRTGRRKGKSKTNSFPGNKGRETKRVFKSNASDELQNQTFDYRELFLYMEHDPELKQKIFKEFYIIQKPRIDLKAKKSKSSGMD